MFDHACLEFKSPRNSFNADYKLWGMVGVRVLEGDR